MRARLVVVATVTGLCLVAQARAPRVVAAQNAPAFTAESALVVLHVTVRDKQGHYVGGLEKGAFDIFEDGRPQVVSFFTAEDAPVTVGLLVDSSGSMQHNRDLILAAAATFVERNNPHDEVFGLTFNDDVRPALPPGTQFTSDPHVLRQALADTITTSGRTALYDAIADGIDYLASGRHERKVLVVVSDGGDNASEATFDQILSQVRASNVVIHAVGLVDPAEPDANPKRLRQLAEASGGIAFRPGDASQVRDALERVALDIRSAYTLGYAPADTEARGFRHIRAGVRVPNARGIVVRTRAGYMTAPGRIGRAHAE